VIRSETQEAYEVAMHSNWHQTELLVIAKQKNKEMNDLRGFCSHGMPTRLPPHRGGRSMDLRQPGGQQKRC
jgi:hypothetical protein